VNSEPGRAKISPLDESEASAGTGSQPSQNNESATRRRARGPRVLATVTDYADLVGALRQRCDQLNVTFEQVDEVAGFCDRYTSKLLCPSARPLRKFGHVSLGVLLGALGLKLQLVEDPAALARVRDRYRPRKHARPRGWTARQPVKKQWETPVIEDPANPDG
jgi:hypothetical protein